MADNTVNFREASKPKQEEKTPGFLDVLRQRLNLTQNLERLDPDKEGPSLDLFAQRAKNAVGAPTQGESSDSWQYAPDWSGQGGTEEEGEGPEGGVPTASSQGTEEGQDQAVEGSPNVSPSLVQKALAVNKLVPDVQKKRLAGMAGSGERVFNTESRVKNPETGEWEYKETPQSYAGLERAENMETELGDTLNNALWRRRKEVEADRLGAWRTALQNAGVDSGIHPADADVKIQALGETPLISGEEGPWDTAQEQKAAVEAALAEYNDLPSAFDEKALEYYLDTLLEKNGISAEDVLKVDQTGLVDDAGIPTSVLGLSGDYAQAAHDIFASYLEADGSDPGDEAKTTVGAAAGAEASNPHVPGQPTEYESYLAESLAKNPEYAGKLYAATAYECYDWYCTAIAGYDGGAQFSAFATPLEFQMYAGPEQFYEYVQFCNDTFGLYTRLEDEDGTINYDEFLKWYQKCKNEYDLISSFQPEDETQYFLNIDVFAFDVRSAQDTLDYMSSIGYSPNLDAASLYALSLGERQARKGGELKMSVDEANAILDQLGEEGYDAGVYREGGEYSARNRGLDDYWNAYNAAIDEGQSEDEARLAARNWLYTDNTRAGLIPDEEKKQTVDPTRYIRSAMLDNRIGFNA